MKTYALLAFLAVAGSGFSFAEDLEIRLMSLKPEGGSPIKVQHDEDLPGFLMLTKEHVDLLTTDDPKITPTLALREVRTIRNAQGHVVYKVDPNSIGLKGYQSLEFSVEPQADGEVKVNLDWVRPNETKKCEVTGHIEYLVVELRGSEKGKSVFCSLAVGALRNNAGQQDVALNR